MAAGLIWPSNLSVFTTTTSKPNESESDMKHTEHEYIDLGYRYEQAKSPQAGQAVASAIRTLMEAEEVYDRAEARHLVERGRQEARATA